ncbi:hypothetical protein F5J12DRAFT_398143 [Pisolithus orientalis]|uniref:uncharacterized protein n=1 Tax=Pisolithus orientalis TaxID=936130 RepID=UPI002223FCDE|nr:uncharacterized protein F5J12DRAFT_398143 [Pisolithus orientalis]KAI6028856.1 hypothetical protein F5J12DRAFT_398143 [Pisolithus orientalis]
MQTVLRTILLSSKPTTAGTSISHTVTRLLSTNAAPSPWFVDPEPQPSQKHTPPHLTPKVQEFPPNLPGPIRQLYTKLSQSPLLELSTLDVRESVAPPPGLPLPKRAPRGRRRRGGTYAGEGIDEDAVGGLWNWVVIAQVKEGTENRGSIAAVLRTVRKTLLTMDTPICLPPGSKRRAHNGWAVVDAGNFAVHILSRDARQKYFEHLDQ